MSSRSIATLLLLAPLFLSEVDAAVIAAWDVNNIDVNNDLAGPAFAFAATTVAPNATGTLTLSSSVNPSTSNNQYGFKISAADTQTTLTGAIAKDHFVEFALSIAPGFELDLSSLDFNAETTSTGADDVALLTSIDGFSAGNEIAQLSGRQAVGAGDLDTDASGFGGLIDLSASQYQDLTGAVSFRLYGFNTGSGSGVTYFRDLSGDDLIVNGTLSAVPEPTHLGLMFVVTAGVVAYRRRRSARQ